MKIYKMKTAEDILDNFTADVYAEGPVFSESGYSYSTVIKAMEEYANQSKQSGFGGWVATSERLPEIDQDDKWNSEYKITKDVLTYSKEWGMRFGRYHYPSEHWTVDGVTSSRGVNVDCWALVKPPAY